MADAAQQVASFESVDQMINETAGVVAQCDTHLRGLKPTGRRQPSGIAATRPRGNHTEALALSREIIAGHRRELARRREQEADRVAATRKIEQHIRRDMERSASPGGLLAPVVGLAHRLRDWFMR